MTTLTKIEEEIIKRLNERLDFLVNCNSANEDLKPEIANDIRNLFKFSIKKVADESRKEEEKRIVECVQEAMYGWEDEDILTVLESINPVYGGKK